MEEQIVMSKIDWANYQKLHKNVKGENKFLEPTQYLELVGDYYVGADEEVKEEVVEEPKSEVKEKPKPVRRKK